MSTDPAAGEPHFEDVLRRYLAYLDDEQSLVDEGRLAELEGQIAAASDPIEKLRLLSERERVSQGGDAGALEAAVVEGLRSWAEESGVTRGALEQVGVPRRLLDRAGIAAPVRSGRAGRSTRRSGRSGRASERAPRLGLDQVKAVVTSQLGARWKLAELAAALDREPATARNYLNRLLEEGYVTELGDDPAHDGRGRAPKLYTRSV